MVTIRACGMEATIASDIATGVASSRVPAMTSVGAAILRLLSRKSMAATASQAAM